MTDFLSFGSKEAEQDDDVLGMNNVLESFLTLYCMRGKSWQHQTFPKHPPDTITSSFIFVAGPVVLVTLQDCGFQMRGVELL